MKMVGIITALLIIGRMGVSDLTAQQGPAKRDQSNWSVETSQSKMNDSPGVDVEGVIRRNENGRIT